MAPLFRAAVAVLAVVLFATCVSYFNGTLEFSPQDFQFAPLLLMHITQQSSTAADVPSLDGNNSAADVPILARNENATQQVKYRPVRSSVDAFTISTCVTPGTTAALSSSITPTPLSTMTTYSSKTPTVALSNSPNNGTLSTLTKLPSGSPAQISVSRLAPVFHFDPAAEGCPLCPLAVGRDLKYNPANVMRVIAGNDTLVVGAVAYVELPASARNIMIVAHADDETIFGGADLLAGPPFSWVVVALNRCGPRRRQALVRVATFYRLAAFFVLDHVDTSGLTHYDSRVVVDIINILRRRVMWDSIVTHALRGEYGHSQHKSLHMIVTELLNRRVSDTLSARIFDFSACCRARTPEQRAAVDARNMSAKLAPVMEMYGELVMKTFGTMTKWNLPSRPMETVNSSQTRGSSNLSSVVCFV